MAKQTKMKTMRLSIEVIRKVEQMAKEQNRTFTNMVETILIKATNIINFIILIKSK